MLYPGTDPESYITEYTLVYEDYGLGCRASACRDESTHQVMSFSEKERGNDLTQKSRKLTPRKSHFSTGYREQFGTGIGSFTSICIGNGHVCPGVGGVPREQKMLKGHLPRVIYHQVYYSIRRTSGGSPRYLGGRADIRGSWFPVAL